MMGNPAIERLAAALQPPPRGYDAQSAPKPLQPIYETLAPDPNAEYGSILPFARDKATGDKRFAMPSMLREGLLGVADLLSGVDTGQVTPRGAETLAAGGFGAGSLLAKPGALASGAAPIRAYHGSPHNFDKFDLSKIGTGEGAQAYGHGLYFAEREGVAKGYKNTLSPTIQTKSPLDHIETRTAQTAMTFGGGASGAVEWINKNRGVVPALTDNVADSVIAKIKSGEIKPGGHMYEVNIHADPNKFLDWDKPLVAQSPEVQNALSSFGIKADKAGINAHDDALLAALTTPGPTPPLPKMPPNPMGANIYESSKIVPGGYRDPVAASANLRDAGIPGIRYLDGGSRSAGAGSSNYVTFDDRIVEILRKYALGVPAPVAAPASQGSSIFIKDDSR